MPLRFDFIQDKRTKNEVANDCVFSENTQAKGFGDDSVARALSALAEDTGLVLRIYLVAHSRM